MSRPCYRLRPLTQLQDMGDGAAQLRHPGGPLMMLDADAMKPVMLADGTRTEEEIWLELARQGEQIPLDEVQEIFLRLLDGEVVERVETPWKPLEPPAWPAHRCAGCGACCQGRWVGPLEPEFVEITKARMPELRVKYPRLGGIMPFVRTHPEMHALSLNASSGQCLFLDEHRRCILHLEYGPEGKPAACRAFPHVRLEDDGHTRLGVGLTCLRHFDQVIDQEPPAPAEHWQAVHDAMDGRLVHARPAPRDDSFEVMLEEHLALPSRPDALTVAMRLLRLPAEGDPTTPNLKALARRHLFRLDEILEDTWIQEHLEGLPGVYPDRVRELRALTAAARQGGETFRATVDQVPGPTPEITRMVDDALIRMLYLREYRRYRSLEHALAVLALGVWTGLALAKDARHFGELLATWFRKAEMPDAIEGLFRHPNELENFFRRFQPLWDPGAKPRKPKKVNLAG